MQIGDKIRQLRLKERWTQKELAQRMNIGQSTLSEYEKNISAGSIKLLERFAEIFKVETSYFFDDKVILSDHEVKKEFKVTDDYQFILNIIKSVVEDANVNEPEDISKEMICLIEAAVKETVRRIKCK